MAVSFTETEEEVIERFLLALRRKKTLAIVSPYLWNLISKLRWQSQWLRCPDCDSLRRGEEYGDVPRYAINPVVGEE